MSWRRLPSLLLLMSWFLLGTGAMAHLHDLQHAEHDAAPFKYDDTNCQIHAQLHAPAVVDGGQVAVVGTSTICSHAHAADRQVQLAELPSSAEARAPPAA